MRRSVEPELGGLRVLQRVVGNEAAGEGLGEATHIAGKSWVLGEQGHGGASAWDPELRVVVGGLARRLLRRPWDALLHPCPWGDQLPSGHSHSGLLQRHPVQSHRKGEILTQCFCGF